MEPPVMSVVRMKQGDGALWEIQGLSQVCDLIHSAQLYPQVPLCFTGQGFHPQSAGRDSETLTSINYHILKSFKILLSLCSGQQ